MRLEGPSLLVVRYAKSVSHWDVTYGGSAIRLNGKRLAPYVSTGCTAACGAGVSFARRTSRRSDPAKPERDPEKSQAVATCSAGRRRRGHRLWYLVSKVVPPRRLPPCMAQIAP
jgi:hypothetical protein